MNFNEYIHSMKPDIVKSVQDMVRIRSVKDEPKDDAPFGEGINRALMYALDIAASMGFKTKNLNGYIGYAEYGQGEETVGIIGHLDVVHEGSGWTYPPFTGEIHADRIYGRGAIDDKGPIIAALYALKAIKDSAVSLSKKIRIIFGTDEENGWEDIKKYLEQEKAPDIGFVPDGFFPAVNSEIGSIDIEFSKEIARKSKGMIEIKSIKCDDNVNTIPNECTCELKLKGMAKYMLKDILELYDETKKTNMIINEIVDMYTIISKSNASNNKDVSMSKNAIGQLIEFLAQFSLGQNDVSDFIKYISKFSTSENSGKKVHIEYADSHNLNYTVYLTGLYIDEDTAKAVINIRYPIESSYDKLMEFITNDAASKKVNMDILRHRAPLYIPEDSILISTLLNTYNSVVGEEGSVVSVNGQTYAKAFNNMAAFGPLFPGEIKTSHKPDESMDIDNLIKCTEIYSQAIYQLAK
ncbi:putative dipeptidase [Oxobacter pfennigii]|uniref:Putative dipeptidase n=1 Tax=Oxobacter pfennigii TaxID=36849 RepID=A0A0P8YZP6_9CLOT|nr:dipeptidase PepV [Oxobacter pfennigii]KPU45358.1 putative dipeptidase [Oxobacter pfennigii]